jgi:hypothetical protein
MKNMNKRGTHNRKTSVLTKGLQISRHERNRSRTPNLQVTCTENATTTIEQIDISPQHTGINYNLNVDS